MTPELGFVMPSCSTWIDVLSWRSKRHPERRAITFLSDGEKEGGTLTYGQLERRARSVAAQLQSQKAEGERVLLVFPSGLDYVAAFFGCLYAGAVAVPVYPPRMNRNLTRLSSIVESCEPALALTTGDIFARIEPLLPQNGLGGVQWFVPDDSTDHSDQWREPALSGESLAFLQYTSGSTSSPKGVQISHGNLLANHRMIAAGFEQIEHLTYVSWLPLFHDMGLIGNLLQGLFGGNHGVLMPPEAFLMKPVRWLQAISRYQAKGSGGPDFAFDLCARKITPEQRANLDLRCWELAFCGAEPVRAKTLEFFAEAFRPCGFQMSAFYPCYGLAESTLFASGGAKSGEPTIIQFEAAALEHDLARVANPDVPQKDKRALVSCGHPWLDGKVAIVDSDSLVECAQGTVGEVWLSGPHVAQGYWNRPDESLHSFDASMAMSDENWLRTGDLGFFHDGELFLTGRLKDLVIIAGRNHYPDDIEASVVASHSSLRLGGCAAFSIEMEGVEVLAVVAEVERFGLASLDSKAVIQAIRQAVAENHDLRAHTIRLILPASLPKTSSGKTQRHLCREKLLNGTLSLMEN